MGERESGLSRNGETFIIPGEIRAEVGVPFMPFAEFPEIAGELMRIGSLKTIVSDYVFREIRGRFLIWGGRYPYPGESKDIVRYDLFPLILVPSYSDATEVSQRYSLGLKGVGFLRDEILFDGDAPVSFQTIPNAIKLAHGTAPSLPVELGDIRQIEATWFDRGAYKRQHTVRLVEAIQKGKDEGVAPNELVRRVIQSAIQEHSLEIKEGDPFIILENSGIDHSWYPAGSCKTKEDAIERLRTMRAIAAPHSHADEFSSTFHLFTSEGIPINEEETS